MDYTGIYVRGEGRDYFVTALGSITRGTYISIDAISHTLGGASCIRPRAGTHVITTTGRLNCQPGIVTGTLQRKQQRALKIVMPQLRLALFSRVLPNVRRRTRQLKCSALVSAASSSPRQRGDYLRQVRGDFISNVVVANAKHGGQLLHDVRTDNVTIARVIQYRRPHVDDVMTSCRTYNQGTISCLCSGNYHHVTLVTNCSRRDPFGNQCRNCSGTVTTRKLRRLLTRSARPIGDFRCNCRYTGRLLQSRPRLSTVLTPISLRKLNILHTLGRRNVQIPRRIGIVDVANRTVNRVLRADVASVRVPTFRVNRGTTRLAVVRVRDPDRGTPAPRSVRFPCALARERAA